MQTQFGSDNHSGVHPEIMKAIQTANDDYSIAYGDDEFTDKAVEKFKSYFGKNIAVFFVGNGTAANIIGLKTITNSFNSIICAKTSHLNVHECGGPEKFTGCKLITIPTKNGKLTVDLIKPYMTGFGDPHMVQPKVISVTQNTELGTIYNKEEIKKLADYAHDHNMYLHVDGARFCNAAASLSLEFADISSATGVDVLSFGGTKNGMMYGDAVIFFEKELSNNFEYYRKQGMHLTSKMRFISAQFTALLSNNLWFRNAQNANNMAKLLYENIKDLSGLYITQKVESNAIFAILSKKAIKDLKKKYFFHVFDELNSEVRWMCSYNTTEKDVLGFAEAIKRALI